MAASAAALAGRAHFDPSDIRAACQALHRHSFESLAQAIDTSGGWAQLAVSPDTAEELRSLELRCRYRERIPGGPGVRALLKGPSGTGKTLAAKALASALEMDLYRVDLSTVVNKYIGETEKNLNQIFSLAEELDVILFLDEGDALLAPRTGVQNSNDRYANLETNYLLQRVESFEGILVVATNAGDRIDGAFQRRMDVAIAFRPPETAERWIIWQLHLPEDHAVDASVLSEVARRCVLTGGQIRNASHHAALLAMDGGSAVTPAMLRSAVEREYRKAGGVCPLRSAD
jgi:SpoVK/Ycf46/Vps4 family AAA+-type ATPase